MKVPDRPSKMPEIRNSKRKEESNACATLMTCNLQKETASKQNNTPWVWRLDPKRYSSWTRLVRVHARVRRVLHNMRDRDNRNASMELQPEEIKGAEEEIVRFAQRQAFRDGYAALSSGKPIPKKSQLITLNPCIDDDGVIRSDGRSDDTRFPIILPRGHWVTKLIVKNYHERGNHAAGVNFIFCQLSERFWIIAARKEIREWDHECNECKRGWSKPACQIMAPFEAPFQLQTFRPNSRRFCWSFVHCSRTPKTTKEEVAVPSYLLGNSSRAFRDGLGTWYRHVLKRLRPFHQSPWSS